MSLDVNGHNCKEIAPVQIIAKRVVFQLHQTANLFWRTRVSLKRYVMNVACTNPVATSSYAQMRPKPAQ